MKTQAFETDSGTVNLRRPNFAEMKSLGNEASLLVTAESAQELLFSETFDKLMKTVAVEDADYTTLMEECDLVDVWNVWQQYMKFARFEDFFMEAEASHQERLQGLREKSLDRTMAELERMKKRGYVPSDFSLSDAAKAEDPEEAIRRAMSESGSAKQSKKGAKKK